MRYWLAAIGALLSAFPVHAVPDAADISDYRALIAQDLRLATTGYRLAFANRSFCKKQERNPGWVIHDVAQYSDVKSARAAFAFEEPMAVAAVVPSGPAALAGIVPGDGLAAIGANVLDLTNEPDERPTYKRVLQVKALAGQLLSVSGRLPLTLVRNQQRIAKKFEPPLICPSDFQVDTNSNLDAGANGSIVRVTSAMMEYVANDDELAAVVAHELAHNLLAHRIRLSAVKPRKMQAILATEIEADRLSVWLMTNAGYDPNAALRFWKRFGKQYGLGIFTEGTHLRWKRRVAIMQSEIDLMAKTDMIDGALPPPLLVGQ